MLYGGRVGEGKEVSPVIGDVRRANDHSQTVKFVTEEDTGTTTVVDKELRVARER